MRKLETDNEFFCELTKQINSIYEDYARTAGLSYTSLHMLHMIYLTENCTQKMIADQTFLPKQTVHSVVQSFLRQGLVDLYELPEDRRIKTLHLTQKGEAFAKGILPKITQAELNSLKQFDDSEREQLLKLMQKYVAVLTKEFGK